MFYTVAERFERNAINTFLISDVQYFHCRILSPFYTYPHLAPYFVKGSFPKIKSWLTLRYCQKTPEKPWEKPHYQNANKSTDWCSCLVVLLNYMPVAFCCLISYGHPSVTYLGQKLMETIDNLGRNWRETVARGWKNGYSWQITGLPIQSWELKQVCESTYEKDA